MLVLRATLRDVLVETVTDAHPPSPSIVPTWTGDNDSNEYCSPTTFRGIDWNWTRVGATNIQSCPGGTTGFAKWNCTLKNSEPHWWPQTPDLSGCRSVWLTSLEQRVQAGRDPLVSITNDLAQVTSSKTLYGGDMMITTKIIEKLAKKMSQDIQTFPDPRQREAIVTEMLHDVVKTSSNLLDASQHASWKDLSFMEQMNVATSLLIELEENAFLLADTVTREKTVDQTVKNISKYLHRNFCFVETICSLKRFLFMGILVPMIFTILKYLVEIDFLIANFQPSPNRVIQATKFIRSVEKKIIFSVKY